MPDTNCDFCGKDTAKFGTATCPRCGQVKCVENCIPGGNRTVCVSCEEDIENGDT